MSPFSERNSCNILICASFKLARLTCFFKTCGQSCRFWSGRRWQLAQRLRNMRSPSEIGLDGPFGPHPKPAKRIETVKTKKILLTIQSPIKTARVHHQNVLLIQRQRQLNTTIPLRQMKPSALRSCLFQFRHLQTPCDWLSQYRQ